MGDGVGDETVDAEAAPNDDNDEAIQKYSEYLLELPVVLKDHFLGELSHLCMLCTMP